MADHPAASAPRSRRWAALGGSALLTARLIGVLLTVAAAILAFALVVVGVGLWWFPACVRALRAQLAGIADMHARWTGAQLRLPTLPASEGGGPAARAWHVGALLRDAETWRLLRWAVLDTATGIGIVLAAMPLGLVGWGLEGALVLPLLHAALGIVPTQWYAFVPVFEPAGIPFAVLLGLGFIVLGIVTGPWWLRLHGRWAAMLLGGDSARLRERVDELTVSRAATTRPPSCAASSARCTIRRNRSSSRSASRSAPPRRSWPSSPRRRASSSRRPATTPPPHWPSCAT